MEISAKKAYNITEPVYNAKRTKQIKSIFKRIERCARKGEFSFTTLQLYPENKSALERLGYIVTPKFNIYHGVYTVIEWRNV